MLPSHPMHAQGTIAVLGAAATVGAQTSHFSSGTVAALRIYCDSWLLLLTFVGAACSLLLVLRCLLQRGERRLCGALNIQRVWRSHVDYCTMGKALRQLRAARRLQTYPAVVATVVTHHTYTD